jgi:hypothetical protein
MRVPLSVTGPNPLGPHASPLAGSFEKARAAAMTIVTAIPISITNTDELSRRAESGVGTQFIFPRPNIGASPNMGITRNPHCGLQQGTPMGRA